MRKNIIHITGSDSYGIEIELTRWIQAFKWKYWDINIDRFDLSDTSSLKWIWDIILMAGLFTQKRLFIFRGGRDRKSKGAGLEVLLEEKLESIPTDHFLLFHNIWEKEEWLTSWLAKNADTRKIDTLWDAKSWIARSGLEVATVTRILATYRESELGREKTDNNPLLGHDIAHTMEMVSLRQESGEILHIVDITDLCHGYGGDTMFALADAIMAINIPFALDILHRISTTSKVDEWFGGFMGTLRNSLYIKYLKYHGSSESEIASIVKIHPFVLKKWYSSRISYPSLKKLYEKFVTMSVAYKRGKWLQDSELWRVLTIELALLDLQK